MTQEEKAKAYDEALKIARCWLNDPQTIQDCNYTIEDAIQNIFPVLAKNEDEMIRKELINWINGKTTYEWSYEWCENKDRWIAYLEKQKEQKSYSLIYDKDLDKAAREYYLSGGADSPIDSTGLVPIVRMAEFGATWMKERMEKEQKPAEWSAKGRRGRIGSTPEHIRKKAENFLSKMEPPYDADDICSAYETGAMESIKQEWSEEDEEMLNSCISSIEESKENRYAYKENDGDTSYDREIAWLKSLRPQPKQEWSKEDENIYNKALDAIYYKDLNDKDEVVDSLKALCDLIARKRKVIPPYAHWKPSEEQMEWLKSAVRLSTNKPHIHGSIISLYEQLKKL